MPSRKSHTKSRHGCLQCKRRKVRCDHGKPICGNCTKRQEKCEYRLNLETAHISGPLSVTNRSNNASPSNAEQQQETVDLNLIDLELLHHFCTEVYTTFSGNVESQEMWRKFVPKEGFRHPFLMHCILAVSAVHLVYQNGPDVHGVAAVKHHDRGLSIFRPLLNHINSQNCEAIFASSALLLIFSTATHHVIGLERRPTPLAAIIELVELAKGVHAVVLSGYDEIRAGFLYPMVHPRDWTEHLIPVPEDFSQAIGTLRDSVDASVQDEKTKSTYLAAISQIDDNCHALEYNPEQFGLALLFLTIVGREFLDLLQAQDPMALVIMAHYGVLLHRERTTWWISDWGYKLVAHLSKILENPWRSAIAFPIQQVGLDAGS